MCKTEKEIHVRTLLFSTGALLSCNLLSINYISCTGPQCEHTIKSLNATYQAISDVTKTADPEDPAMLQGCGWEILYSLFLLSDPSPHECLSFRLSIRKQVASNPQFWHEGETLIGGQTVCQTDLDGYIIDRLSNQCSQTEASFAALTLLLRVRGKKKISSFLCAIRQTKFASIVQTGCVGHQQYALKAVELFDCLQKTLDRLARQNAAAPK